MVIHATPIIHVVLQLGEVGQGTFGRVVHAAVLNSFRSEDVAIKLLPRGTQVRSLLGLKQLFPVQLQQNQPYLIQFLGSCATQLVHT